MVWELRRRSGCEDKNQGQRMWCWSQIVLGLGPLFVSQNTAGKHFLFYVSHSSSIRKHISQPVRNPSFPFLCPLIQTTTSSRQQIISQPRLCEHESSSRGRIFIILHSVSLSHSSLALSYLLQHTNSFDKNKKKLDSHPDDPHQQSIGRRISNRLRGISRALSRDQPCLLRYHSEDHRRLRLWFE